EMKHYRNGTEIWVVFQSLTEYYLFYWNLVTPLKTDIWYLTDEIKSSFGFHNSTLLVYSVKINELFVTQYKLIPGKDITILEESKIVTMENEVRKIQLSNAEIILEDVYFYVVKVHFKNLLKFFNELKTTNLVYKTSMIPFYIGIPLSCIGSGFLGAFILYAYLKSQYKFIKHSHAKQQRKNAFEHQQRLAANDANEDAEDAEEEPLQNDNIDDDNDDNDGMEDERHERVEMVLMNSNKNANANDQQVQNNTVANNHTHDSNSRQKETENSQENQHKINQKTSLQNKMLQFKTTETQTSENGEIQINENDSELCID
uniref:Uncharacterized protein n=1 Tax=Panagrolaimus sp. ES5 TaxID=591445 RepID=A0AC34GDU4_9BILA